jgi:hypothetical protein
MKVVKRRLGYDQNAAAPPPGEWAIVELFGHTTLVGRITEVERFGAKMMAIEPLFRDTLLPMVLHGGAAIYRLTPCSAEVAFAKQPRHAYQLPTAINCIVPPLLLETPPDAPAPLNMEPDPYDEGDWEPY